MSVSAIRVPLASSQPGTIGAWIDEAGNLVVPAAALPPGVHGTARSVVIEGAGRAGGSWPTRSGRIVAFGASLLLIATLVLSAANGHRWAWTGFAGTNSLWDWLRLFAQPVALVFMTLRLRTVDPAPGWRVTGRLGAFVLAVLVVAGYGAHWRWTGFPGKQLWDWLELMLLPIVAVLLPEWVRRGEPFGPPARLAAVVAAFGFVLLVVGGYSWGWTWTGFTGNPFRDWLDLMIAPFLLPVAL
jgi:hypothetical protein